MDNKTIYKTFDNDKARLLLGDLNTKNLIIIGVNPSYATDKISDRTITKVKKFSELNKFNGWLMLNIYPQRTTDPKCLHKKYSIDYHTKNLIAIKKIMMGINSPTIWCAWGNTITIRSYLFQLLKEIYNQLLNLEKKICWITIGDITKKGHPRHPVRLPYYNKIYHFDISKYIEKNN